jgi:hypothetical protein
MNASVWNPEYTPSASPQLSPVLWPMPEFLCLTAMPDFTGICLQVILYEMVVLTEVFLFRMGWAPDVARTSCPCLDFGVLGIKHYRRRRGRKRGGDDHGGEVFFHLGREAEPACCILEIRWLTRNRWSGETRPKYKPGDSSWRWPVTNLSHLHGSPSSMNSSAFLWIASVASNIGTMMQEVGASWLMTELAPSPLMVALIQTAGALPVLLLSFAAGALADIVDRRRLLIFSQSWMLVAAAGLGILTVFHLTSPPHPPGLHLSSGLWQRLDRAGLAMRSSRNWFPAPRWVQPSRSTRLATMWREPRVRRWAD